jgi:hypothetical protein
MSQLNSRRTRHGAWPASAIAAIALGLPAVCAAAVQSQIDRTTVTVGEPFALTIESDDTTSGLQPDLAPLRKDFAVLGTEAASDTSIVNGARTDRTRWIVRLQPLHPGSSEIPALAVGQDRTAPIDVTVSMPSAAARAEMSQHAFLETDTVQTGKSPYVQQQVPYTVRLFVDGDVQGGSLNPPDAGPDAVVEQLGKDKRTTASRHGRDYTVIERQYAISPEKSGPLKVAPASFQGTVNLPVAAGASDADPADDLMARMLRNTPFANDPMFRSGLMANLAGASTTRTLAAQGQGLALDIRARPAGAKSPWLPAQQVTLHDSWTDAPPQFKVGEPVTRVITIEAKGLAASQIPTLTPVVPSNARVYPEATDNQSSAEGASIDGVSKQTLTYIPSAEGTMDISPLDLAWWDTAADAARTVSLPGRQFKVEAGAEGAQAEAPVSQTAPATAQPSAVSSEIGRGGGMWRQLKSTLSQAAIDRRWLVALLAGLAVLVVGLAAVRRRARRQGTDGIARDAVDVAKPASPPMPDRRSSLRALQEACRANDAMAAAQALLSLARVEWPDDPPRGLAALAARLKAGVAEVAVLDRCLYGASAQASDWTGQGLWERFKGGLGPTGSRPVPARHELDDLYRSGGVSL